MIILHKSCFAVRKCACHMQRVEFNSFQISDIIRNCVTACKQVLTTLFILDTRGWLTKSPGPDLVICDEGHRIKNAHASISQALKNIKTK